MKILLFLALSLFSTNLMRITETSKNTISKPTHSEWNLLLQKYVDQEGNVNYKTFKENRKLLQRYLDILALNSPSADWSKQEKLAYYINLYNAATVKLIIDNYPLKSIKDIHSPWDKKWIRIGKATYSLGQIEHKILRKMNEPRIHFAINCASYSCPKLFNVAFTAANVEELLKMAATDFINDAKRNKITKDKLQLSTIFKWYKDDFREYKSLIAYLQFYTKIEINPSAKLDYLEYNWSLNDIK